MELSRIERIVQTAAAVFGISVAGFVSYRVGTNSGVDVGVATFILSWTLVALFVLLVRFVTARLLSSGATFPPDSGTSGSASDEPASSTSGKSRHRRRRRRR